jgi:23S rRNA (pseudouridine1915-N3)-methyltransferase
MKVTLIVIGKTDSSYLQEGVEDYSKRIDHYVNFDIKVIPANRSNRNNEDYAGREILKILTGSGPGRDVVLLDENGKQFSSPEFSVFLEKKMLSGLRELIFIIGGPFGFSEEIRKMAGSLLSVSKMTFSHQMVRLLFLEQLYRAFTIIKGEPYHHE